VNQHGNNIPFLIAKQCVQMKSSSLIEINGWNTKPGGEGVRIIDSSSTKKGTSITRDALSSVNLTGLQDLSGFA